MDHDVDRTLTGRFGAEVEQAAALAQLVEERAGRYTTAASTARSSAGRCPPPCGRLTGVEISGCASYQKSSDAQVRIMSSITNGRSCRRTTSIQLRHALSLDSWTKRGQVIARDCVDLAGFESVVILLAW